MPSCAHTMKYRDHKTGEARCADCGKVFGRPRPKAAEPAPTPVKQRESEDA